VKVFPTNVGWKEAIDSRGATDMRHLWKLFETLRWNDLMPDTRNNFLVAGYGEPRTARYATAATTQDGRLAVIYFASINSGRFTLDLKKESAPFRGYWYDPTNGETLLAPTFPISTAHRTTLPFPGKNLWEMKTGFSFSAQRTKTPIRNKTGTTKSARHQEYRIRRPRGITDACPHGRKLSAGPDSPLPYPP